MPSAVPLLRQKTLKWQVLRLHLIRLNQKQAHTTPEPINSLWALYGTLPVCHYEGRPGAFLWIQPFNAVLFNALFSFKPVS